MRSTVPDPTSIALPLTVDIPRLLPALRRLADEVAELNVVVRIVESPAWADQCGWCPEPPNPGDPGPTAPVALVRRSDQPRGYGVPTCASCLWHAIRWEQQFRASTLIAVELLAVPS